MQLDVLSLLTVAAVNMCMLSLALPLIMGSDLSPAARHARASVIVQAAAWVCMVGASAALDRGLYWLDHLLSTFSIACMALTQWLMYRALVGWLGPRPWPRVQLALLVLTPLGYTLGFGHYALRVGWANFLLAAMLLIVARSALWPARPAAGGWRQLLLVCMLTMAGFTAARGYLGAFTDLYPSFRAPHPVNLGAAVATNIFLVLSVVALLTAWRDEAEQQLRLQARTDALTGLLNRRGFDERCAGLLAQARRHQWSLTALMLDIDDFKPINDRHGHGMGDAALRLLAQCLQAHTRSGDIVARLGGDEFAIVLLSGGDHLPLARRLRTCVQSQAPAALGFSLEFSMGAATLAAADDDMATLLARADAALYAAKARQRGGAPDRPPLQA